MASALIQDVTDFLMDEESLEFEEEVKRDPYSVKAWCRYIDFRQNASHEIKSDLFKRALKFLPRSYKLWKQYLNEYRIFARGKSITDSVYDEIINAYENALIHMNKMPRIWLDYCNLLVELQKITKSRHNFDRALRSLPITQHERIWQPYLRFIKDINIWETAVRVFNRYMMFDKSKREDYVDYLLSINHYKEAGKQLIRIINDEEFHSTCGKTKHNFWILLCDIVSKYPEEVSSSINVEAIFRSGMKRFSDEVGHLWCTLSNYYIRLGQFECARDIYEEGIETVITVRDFSMIFDAYAKSEEELLTAQMSLIENENDHIKNDEDLDIEKRLTRIEHLMDRRPLLLNSVLLRQNPHDVNEWLKRIQLLSKDPLKTIATFAEAVKTIDPQKAVGKLSHLWIRFAKMYEANDDIENSRVIYEKAITINYKCVNDLALVWTEYGEMEIRHDNFDIALNLLRRATEEPSRSSLKKLIHVVQDKLYRSSKIWSTRIDYEESLGTFSSTKLAYNRAIELKVITPKMILNYASFLEENKYYEDSFTAYEKGIALFSFPHVHEIWNTYLTSFVKRYGGKKLERARDLFEQVLTNVPKENAKIFYIQYAELEEKYGLLRHAMSIYNRATKKVKENETFEMYLLCIKKVEEFFGIIKTREIYEDAIKNLSKEDIPIMCLRFAQMECRLGEIDRSRAIYLHASQYCDPRINQSFWTKWHEFEVSHGNEDTFLEMLRIKRSVSVQYSQVNYIVNDMVKSTSSSTTTTITTSDNSHLIKGNDAMKQLEEDKKLEEKTILEEEQSEKGIKRKSQDIQQENSNRKQKQQQIERKVEFNPEEIDLDEVELEEQEIPDTLFKGIRPTETTKKAVGALERFKKAQ